MKVFNEGLSVVSTFQKHIIHTSVSVRLVPQYNHTSNTLSCSGIHTLPLLPMFLQLTLSET